MNAPQLLYWWLVTATLLVGRAEAVPARVAAWSMQVGMATGAEVGAVSAAKAAAPNACPLR